MSSSQAPAPAKVAAPHGEPAKKERAPVADDALVALKAQLKRAEAAQEKYSHFTQEQVRLPAVHVSDPGGRTPAQLKLSAKAAPGRQ